MFDYTFGRLIFTQKALIISHSTLELVFYDLREFLTGNKRY